MVTLLTTGAQAGVVVNGTRVICPAARHEVDISVQNTGNTPALVQASIAPSLPRRKRDGCLSPDAQTKESELGERSQPRGETNGDQSPAWVALSPEQLASPSWKKEQ